MGVDLLITRMRELETDHKPDGWPAVQMKDISGLCDAIYKQKVAFSSFWDSATDILTQEQIDKLENLHRADINALSI